MPGSPLFYSGPGSPRVKRGMRCDKRCGSGEWEFILLTYLFDFYLFSLWGPSFCKKSWPPHPQEKPLPTLFPASHKYDSNLLCAAAAKPNKEAETTTNPGTPSVFSLVVFAPGAHPRRKLCRIEAAYFQRYFRQCSTGVRACAGQEGDGGEKTQEPTLKRMVLTLDFSWRAREAILFLGKRMAFRNTQCEICWQPSNKRYIL